MLSLYTLKSASDASTYYQQGDYYTQGGADEYSLWLGKGAETLGLKGPVQFDTFKSLLRGYLPNGKIMSQVEKGQYHRPGYDLTFSAPKSISILALVADNHAILEAHREAVIETITKLEEKYAGCRNKQQGITHIERSANFTVASFEHSDSREGDPNLHTHCVLMNITQRADGAWRTLYADELYHDKLLNGMEYRSRLAHKLMALGYEIELKEKGLFELKGVDPDLIKFYSKRRAEIEQWLEENQQNSSKAAETANFITRGAKISSNPEVRQERWLGELQAIGSSLEKLNAIAVEAKERGPIQPPEPLQIARNALDSAIRHLAERKNSFSFQEVVKTSQLISLLPCNEGDLLNAIEQRIANKSLIYLEDKTLTTPEIHQIREQNIQIVQSGKNRVNKIAANWIASIATTFKTNDIKERQALIDLLTSTDRQVLLSSNSKMVLQQTLKDYIELTQSQGFYPRVITQNKINVETLKNKLGIERISTIEGFLLACEERIEKRGEPKHILEAWDRRLKKIAARDVWIVDGDISTKQLNRLANYAENLEARIVFTQLKNISALEPLKDNGLTEIKLNVSRETIAHLKLNEQLLKKLDFLDKKDFIQQSEDYGQRQALALEQYMNGNKEGQRIVTLSYHERTELNHLIRERLKETGGLFGETQNLAILRPLNMSNEEKSQLHLYQPGDVLRFNRAISEEICKDSYFTIYRVDLENNFIDLRNNNEQVLWCPNSDKRLLKHVEVYKGELREIQKGDILIWTRTRKDKNNKQLDRVKGQKAIVIEVNENQILVKLQNEQKVYLNSNEHYQQHWDYSYAVHMKDIDLASTKEVIITLQYKQIDAKSIQLLNDLLTTTKTEGIQAKIICDELVKIKKTIQTGGYHNQPLHNLNEAQYKRIDALSHYQILATEPLFNRLQSEYLKVNQTNPELDRTPKPLSVEMSAELRVACDIVDKISLYHSERDAVIKVNELKADIIKSGGLVASVNSLEKAVDLAIEQGWLIHIGENEYGEKLVTTKHTLLIEQKCIDKMKEGKNQLQPIFSKDSAQIKEILNHKRLTEGQKQAINLILTTKDSMVAVQGIAGAGKTTALKEINRLCEAHNYTMVLANTASAKNQAKSASKLEAKTTAQFLTRMETAIDKDLDQAKKDFGGNRLFILDESSLASSRDLLRLQTVVEKLEARLVLVGDFKQQGSIGAGLSFHDLLAYGIDKAVMKENVRLNEPTAFIAMKQAYAGNMAGTLKTLKDSIEEIPNKEEALNRIVDIYIAMISTNKEPPLVITPLNKDRKYVNEQIREKLKASGVLSDKGFGTSVFVSTDKREIDKSDVFNYKRDDVVRFNTNHPRLGVKAGDYAHIQHIDLENQRLILKIDGKQEFYWSPKNLEKLSAIEIYHQEIREFCQGDTIIFKRNNEQQGIFNGDRATITKVEGGTVEILLSSGITIHLDLTQPQNQHLDYGYALTTYAAQGKDVPFVIAYGEGPKTYPRTSVQLKVGDIIVLPKQKLPLAFENENSKVAQLINVDKNNFKLQDREGNTFEVKAQQKEQWDYFPPFQQRKPNELPLSTSQQSFLIQITRGDGLLLIVPNIDDFQNTLAKHQQIKHSALSYTDPKWQDLQRGVNRLVANIKGKAEAKLKVKLSQDPTIEQPKEKMNAFTQNKTSFIDSDELEFRLQRDILGYASQWKESPNMITNHEARWGRKGSFSLILNGPRAGLWHNFETGEKGKGLISLYMHLYQMPFKEAVQELSKMVGLSFEKENNSLRKTNRLEEKKLDTKSEIEKDDQQKRITKALYLYNKSVPIEGTLAEKYLQEHRGIAGDLPSDFRFLERDKHFQTGKYLSALVAPYRDKDGNIIGIVRIYLNQDGSKYQDSFIDKKGQSIAAAAKANKGLSSHGSVLVQEAIIPRILFIAEGLETALSVAKAMPNQTVLASLSVQQIKNVPISPETQQIIICADNDPITSRTKESIIKAVEAFLSKGVKVFIALPPEIPAGMQKYDFNDLLKDDGISAVQKSLEQMVEIKDVNLLKNNEPRLENDINRLRLENQQNELIKDQERSKTTTVAREPSSIQPEKVLEKGIER